MPEVIETTVYYLEELSESAKDSAREWYRTRAFYYEWYSFLFEDFDAICEILGVHLKSRPVRLMGGGTRQDPCIWFTGFWSQGDGASFEGSYSYANGAAAAIRAYAPLDDRLHQIADDLAAVQRRNFYQLSAEIGKQGRYCHEYCMAIAVTRDSPVWQDMTADAEDVVIEALRDLARWLYRKLEAEYDYLSSDDVVDDSISESGFTFTGDGQRFG